MNEPTTEQKTEAIARRMAKERHGSEALWELYLMPAYGEVFDIQSMKDMMP